jgi:hypothetical protein
MRLSLGRVVGFAHDQNGRLVCVDIPLADHAQRSVAEMDRVAGLPVGYGVESAAG